MCNEIGAAATCSYMFVKKNKKEEEEFIIERFPSSTEGDETQYIATESYTNEGFQPLKSAGMQNSD